MDYQYTPAPTVSPPHNTEDAVSTPPTPHPRCSKTCPALLPKPSKAINNNTSNLKLAVRNCQKSVQNKVPSYTRPQPTQKTSLLPTPPVSGRPQIRKTLIPGPPLCSNSQYHYKQYISGPYNAINNKQHPPLLPSPPHQCTI